MTWLMAFRDQMPLLVVLSPLIGFFVTLAAVRTQQQIVRPLAISNSICTVLMFGGLFWSFEQDVLEEADLRCLLVEHESLSASDANDIELMNRVVDRRRTERLSQRWFVIDGTNLWPGFAFALLTYIVFCRSQSLIDVSKWFFLCGLLFESSILAAMMSYELSIFLTAIGVSVFVMSILIGQWGSANRRDLLERFLVAQFCGGLFVMLGFAMLVMAVPWMKIEDSPALPAATRHLATIVYEVQKWASGNQIAFQYQHEVFPWILLILSAGFAIQFGVFPFQWWQMRTLSQLPPILAILVISGVTSVSGIAWLRFVVPLAPELLAKFDWLILTSATGGAIWGAIRAFVSTDSKQRIAYLYLSLTGCSMFGCYSLTRASLSGSWLMQQQMAATFCTGMILMPTSNSNSEAFRPSTRILVLLLGLPTLGFFASGYIIMSELVHESLLFVSLMFVISCLNVATMSSVLINHIKQDRNVDLGHRRKMPSYSVGIGLLVLAVIPNLMPTLILRQCDREIARVFRQFEQLESVESQSDQSH